jgi:hypothetical protein
MKIRPVGADLFHAYERTDRHVEANIRFRNFTKAPPKKGIKINITGTEQRGDWEPSGLVGD